MSPASDTPSPAAPPAVPATTDAPAATSPTVSPATSPASAIATAPTPAIDTTSLAIRAWRKLRREPSLMFTTAYVFVSFIGLWANYWFYRAFQLPILEYMHASDYLVAGLRDLAYGLILLGAVALVLLVTWPDAWQRKHPQRVEQLRRHWWGRAVFSNSRLMRWNGVGLTPETGMAVAAFWATVWTAAWYVQEKAESIRDHGAGRPVQVTLADAAAPQPGHARLLGTSSGFVFLWWPAQRRAEAVPIESVARLQTLPALRKPVPKPAAKPRPAAP